MTLYLFIDVETTGLNFENGNSKPRKNRMLQLAYKLYDEQIQTEYSSGNFFVKYTDESKLIANLQKLDNYAKERNLPAYVPEKIGCGLANGNWNKIKDFIEKETNIIIVSL